MKVKLIQTCHYGAFKLFQFHNPGKWENLDQTETSLNFTRMLSHGIVLGIVLVIVLVYYDVLGLWTNIAIGFIHIDPK